MRDWSVEIEIIHKMEPGEQLDAMVVDVLERLQRYAAAASHDAVTLSVRLSVEAASADAAMAKAVGALLTGLRRTGFTKTVDIIRVEAETAEELEHRLQTEDVPQLAGVAEVARILRVSKQRVSELLKSRFFPRPIAELEASPVWRSSAIIRFAERWKRKPGRPPGRSSQADSRTGAAR